MTPKLLNLAAAMLDKAAAQTDLATDDWAFPADWSEAEKHEFALRITVWNSQDTTVAVYSDEDPPPDFAVMGYLAHLLRREADQASAKVPEGRFGVPS